MATTWWLVILGCTVFRTLTVEQSDRYDQSILRDAHTKMSSAPYTPAGTADAANQNGEVIRSPGELD